MKLVPNSGTVRNALSAHAAMGLLAGALLYLVCLSGTVLVFYEETQRFEQQDAPEMTRIDPAAVQRGIQQVLASERGKPATTHLYVHMPVAELPRTTITTDSQAVHIDAQGSIARPEQNLWSEFLFALHYSLNVPGLVGMTVVGILGMLMLALAVSGLIAHPRIFRDAFSLRARHGSAIALADWHNRLSVWTLPFGLAISLTGAVIGLAGVTTYVSAARYYGGDATALYGSIFGKEAKPDAAKAPLADVAASLRYMQAHHPEVDITYAIVHDPATRGQHVQIVGEHPRRLIFGEYYEFDANGRFQGAAGLADGALGQQAAASNYNLHFGNYGGLPVKIAYCVFGLALTVVSATGVYIWLGKRRRRGLYEPRLLGAWHGIVWGAPAGLLVSLAARFTVGNAAPFTAIFWCCLAVAVGVGTLSFHRTAARYRPGAALLTPGE
jgi:uncharacterized iron-regulated membrane protein